VTEKIAVYIQMDAIGTFYSQVRALQIIQRNSLEDISLDGARVAHLEEEVTQIKQGSNVANQVSFRMHSR
jgi:hypothetical protein